MARNPADLLRENVVRASAWVKGEGPGEAPMRRLHEIMTRASADLESRLREAEGLGGPGAGSFTATQMRVTLNQIEDVLRSIRPMLSSTVVSSASSVATASTKETIAYLEAAERSFKGSAQGLMLNEAAIMDRVSSGMEASVLRRLATSGEPQSSLAEPHLGKLGILDRYGLNVVGKFEEIMQRRFITRAPWNDVRNELIEQSPFLVGRRAEEGAGVATRWAERILRTETMNAHNRAGWQTIVEANKTLKDTIKILVAVFDNRTASDSYAVHGQIRYPEQPFDSWWGSYMHPPNRPNDREVVVPHRMSWPLPKELTPKSDSEVFARWKLEKRRGSPPARPAMEPPGFSRDEIGKAPPPPPISQPGFDEEAPSVTIDGERLPRLGKGMEWGDASPIGYDDISGDKPKGLGLVPWKIVEGFDMGGSARQNRAMRTLQHLRGGSFASGFGPLESLGFDVLKPRTLAKIKGEIEQRVSISATTDRYNLESLLSDPSSGVTRQRVRLDRLSFTRSDFDLFEARNHIRAAEVGGFQTTGAGVVTVKHNGKIYVLQGGSRIAAQRLLGQFEDEVIVIDLDHRSPKPKTNAQFVEALPDGVDSPEKRATFRSSFRDWYANDGIQSRDVAALRTGMGALEIKQLPPGIAGYHLWDGTIQIEQFGDTEAKLERAIAAVKKGQRTASPDLATMFHEESHGFSPCGFGAYRGSGVGLEEATTELYARRKWRELFSVKQPRHEQTFEEDPSLSVVERSRRRATAEQADRSAPFEDRIGFRPVHDAGTWVDNSVGPYREYIAALYDFTHKHTGLHPDAIPDVIDRAIVRMRQGTAIASTPEDLIHMYVDALDGIKVDVRGKPVKVKLGEAKRTAMEQAMLNDTRFQSKP
jgi:hypothetical protein